MWLFLLQLISNQDHVKLVNLGEPRKPELPGAPGEVKTGGFVYLAPEVARGEANYTSGCDVYALGLMAQELWSQELVFKQARTLPLSDWHHAVTPGELQPEPANPFTALIQRSCTASENRVTSTHWVNELRTIRINMDDSDDNTGNETRDSISN